MAVWTRIESALIRNLIVTGCGLCPWKLLLALGLPSGAADDTQCPCNVFAITASLPALGLRISKGGRLTQAGSNRPTPGGGRFTQPFFRRLGEQGDCLPLWLRKASHAL